MSEFKYDLWQSDGLKLIGPISVKLIKIHPNDTATFKITDQAWLDNNGWSGESYVEIQAYPMPEERKVPKRDVYYWEERYRIC